MKLPEPGRREYTKDGWANCCTLEGTVSLSHTSIKLRYYEISCKDTIDRTRNS